MKIGHGHSFSTPKENESPFMRKLRERKILAVLAAYVGSGVVLVEFAFHILVHHYHLPRQIVDIIIITLATAMLCNITLKWFQGEKKVRKLKLEILLIILFILIGGFLNAKQIFEIFKGKPQHAMAFDWENSIAVLPFANLSGDEDQDYFCDGLTEEIINALSNIDELKVVARTSAFAFKGKHMDVRDIGRELQVQNVLEGSVRKGGDQLRITAQLIKVKDGFHLWSGRFDRKMEDVFSIQDEISLAIADVLSLKILGEEKKELIEHETKDSEAYDFYLRGRFIVNNISEESINTAIGLFEKAIKKDPGFTLGYVELADAYSLLPAVSTFPIKEANARAKEYALKALEIDDSLAEAHTMMGVINANEYDWESAEKSFLKAIELNPGNAYTYSLYGYTLGYMGRFEESKNAVRKAIELDPYNLNIARNLGRILYIAGELEEAMNVLRETEKINPSFTGVSYNLALIHLEKAEFEKAREEIHKEKSDHPTWNPVLDAVEGIILAREGHEDDSRLILENLLERSREVHVSAYWIAALSFALDEREQGFVWLEKAYDEQDFFVRWINVEPLFRGVRSDLRFIEIVKKIGLDH
jgi:TolB-like protein/tetratricopeptide (TPR) repeat protein